MLVTGKHGRNGSSAGPSRRSCLQNWRRSGQSASRLCAESRREQARPITPATVNREFAFLKHVFNVAIRDGRIDRNAVARLKMLREPSGRVRYLSDDEEALWVPEILAVGFRKFWQVLRMMALGLG